MVRLDKLKGLLRENGYTYEKLTSILGMSMKTIYTRMKNGNFTIQEADKIKEICKIDNNTLMNIFFD